MVRDVEEKFEKTSKELGIARNIPDILDVLTLLTE